LTIEPASAGGSSLPSTSGSLFSFSFTIRRTTAIHIPAPPQPPPSPPSHEPITMRVTMASGVPEMRARNTRATARPVTPCCVTRYG